MDQEEEKGNNEESAELGAKRNALQRQREDLYNSQVAKSIPNKPEMLGSNGRELIKQWEKLRLNAYIPKAGDRPTIGYGHTKDVKLGDKIDEGQALKYFESDAKDAMRSVQKNVRVPLTQNQHDALVSFVYNVGSGNFKKSTLLKKLNEGKYTEVAGEMRQYNKAKNAKGKLEFSKGLANRREAEIKLFNRRD